MDIEAIRRLVEHRDTNTGRGYDSFSREVVETLLAKIESLAESNISGAELLTALIRQIESADYRHPESGSPLVNNVHFIKAKEAVGK